MYGTNEQLIKFFEYIKLQQIIFMNNLETIDCRELNVDQGDIMDLRDIVHTKIKAQIENP